MNSDEDKLYTKLVAFNEIYNFIVQTFFTWSHLGAEKGYTVQISVYQLFELQDDFKWKSLNYRVVDLIKSYKFRIKFISIHVTP
jgi:hypothetical protein